MKTLFIHLSDIHLRSNDKNIINVDSMFGNLKNKISKSEVVFLLFTGDFSNNAEIKQFDSFKFLFEDIINYLKSAKDNIKIIPLLVPGNHDINLSSEIKKGYIFNQEKEFSEEELDALSNQYILKMNCAIELCSFFECFAGDNKYIDNKTFTFGDVDYHFTLINSAPLSSLKKRDKDHHHTTIILSYFLKRYDKKN